MGRRLTEASVGQNPTKPHLRTCVCALKETKQKMFKLAHQLPPIGRPEMFAKVLVDKGKE